MIAILLKEHIMRHLVWILLIKVDASGVDEAIERCSSMGHVHSRNRPPRADRKESLASLPFCCERQIFEEFISGLFHGDPRGREGTLFRRFRRERTRSAWRAELIERVFCRSIGRRRRIGGRGRKKRGKKSGRGSAGRAKERKEEGSRARKNEKWMERGEQPSVAVTRTPVGPQRGKASLARPTWQLEIWYRIR